MTGVPLVQPGVLEVVTDHVNSAWARKVGGILLGRALDDATRVDAALPARQTDEFAGEIAFPPPVWEEAYASLDEHPGSTIVGWYHSHPGSGVALSDYDRRLHKILFGEPFSVALVVDPVASRMAWFGWDIDQLWPLAGEAAPGPVSAAEPEPRRARHGGGSAGGKVEPGGPRSRVLHLGRQRDASRRRDRAREGHQDGGQSEGHRASASFERPTPSHTDPPRRLVGAAQ